MLKLVYDGIVNMAFINAYNVTLTKKSGSIWYLTGADNALLLKVARFTFPTDTRVSVDGKPSVTLSTATHNPTRRAEKATTQRHRRAAKNAAPFPSYTARDVDGNVITLDAPAQVAHERVRPSIDGTNELNNSIAVDLFLTAWKLGARVPSVELFRTAAAHADNDFEAESFRLAEKLCRRIYR